MNNKFTAELLDKYKLGKITLEDTFEYGKGCIKIGDEELAEFDKIEIHIQPTISNISLMNNDGDNEVTTGYEPIYVRLNIITEFSRYNEIKENCYTQFDIEISGEITISKCNVGNIEGNKMVLQNVLVDNIEMF